MGRSRMTSSLGVTLASEGREVVRRCREREREPEPPPTECALLMLGMVGLAEDGEPDAGGTRSREREDLSW